MPKLYETLPPVQQLEFAARTKSPARLAQTFAAFVGQFYDREAFDTLARQVSDLYDAEGGNTFRGQLDRRLCDRYHAPVAWDMAPTSRHRVS